MESAAYWHQSGADTNGSGSSQAPWASADAQSSLLQQQQQSWATTPADNSACSQVQAEDGIDADAGGWTASTGPPPQPSAQTGQDLPPLPPDEGLYPEAEAPPLPEAPPPLPFEPPPPLPTDPSPGPSEGWYSVEAQQVPGPASTDFHWAQNGSQELPATSGNLSEEHPAEQAVPYDFEAAAHSLDAAAGSWQASEHQQIPAQPPDRAAPGVHDSQPSSEPHAAAYDYTYQAQAPWQATPDAYAAAYGQSVHYAPQQYPAFYQQPQQQHWPHPSAASWQYSSGQYASSQYPAGASYTAPAAYPPPDVAQQAVSMYPAYQAPASVQAGAHVYGAAHAYPPAASAVASGVTASAAGLSGPAQSPIVVVQASDLFEMPAATRRPKKIAILMRGIPGSGKTYITQHLRKMELKVSGDAPRIHCIDDYFMTEVEREEDDLESGKKGKKRKVQHLEYCYEQEMEGSYRRSLLKAYQKTLDEKRFNLVIVDAPNLLVDDFKPYWSAGQNAGYEVYILDPFESDPQTCFTRNIHERSLEDIQGAAACWEPAPPFYPRLDVSSLFGPKPSARSASKGIAEIEMDALPEATPKGRTGPQRSRWTDDDGEGSTEKSQEQQSKRAKSASEANLGQVPSQDEPEAFDGLTAGLDSLVDPKSGKGKSGRASVPSSVKAGLSLSALSKRSGHKSVRWADQAEKADGGFSIGGTAALQLETVYVLSGLGPPPKDSEQPGQKASFEAKARAERTSEHSFKEMMLAKKQR